MVYDDEVPFQINANIIARPAHLAAVPKKVTILDDPEPSIFSRRLMEYFKTSGCQVTLSTINDTPPLDQDIVSLLDLTVPFFDEISSQKFSAFQNYLGQVGSSGILWVTRSVQLGCKDPRYGQVIGVARTVRSELLIDFATLEIDNLDDQAFGALAQVFDKFQRRTKRPDVDPDWEFALYNGCIQIPRLDWFSVLDALSAPLSEELPRSLEVQRPGKLHSLRWVQQRPDGLASDAVEVDVCAVGLNFRVIFVPVLRIVHRSNSFSGHSDIYGSVQRNKGGLWSGRLRRGTPDRHRREEFKNR